MKNGYAAIQPAGAFLQQAKKQETRRLSNPIAVVGSCTDIDEALRLRPDLEVDMEPNLTCQKSKEFEPESFLTAMRRGLEEDDDDENDDEDSDDDSDCDSDDEGCYYQASKENTYYSPGKKLPGDLLLLDMDALDLSGTSTASSSAPTSAWNQQEKDLEEENQEDLIFQLDM